MSTEKAKREKIELMVAQDWPLCPHCGKEIEQVASHYVRRSLVVLSCPLCGKAFGSTADQLPFLTFFG